MKFERRRLALMFTDIVGYSRLMGNNEPQTIELLGEYRRIFLTQIECHSGALIEFVGDAVFARFDSPGDAVNAGIAMLQALDAFNRDRPPELPRLQSRIGVHMGEVVFKENAVYGDDVNIAARLEPIAVADGLCISEEVYRAVEAELRHPVLALGVQRLKNINHNVRCFLLRPRGITLGTRAHYFVRRMYQKFNRYRYPLALSATLLVGAAIYFVPRWLVPGYSANYVEIADFRNLMAGGGQPDYLSVGITEALRAQLADMDSVYVLEAGEGVRGPIRLEGSVQRVGDSLRISYKLIRRRDQVQIVGGQLDAPFADIFLLQDRVVSEIAGYLAREFGLTNFGTGPRYLDGDVDAYDFYMRGLEYAKKPTSKENLDAAINFYTTSLIHDKQFALSLAGLCDAYRRRFVLSKDAMWAQRAEVSCRDAIRLDDDSGRTLLHFGALLSEQSRFDQALEVLQESARSKDTEIDAQLSIANVYRRQNKHDRAKQLLNNLLIKHPKYWKVYREIASLQISAGEYREAISTYKKLLQITPENSFAYNNMGVVFFYIADFESAASAFHNALKISPNTHLYSNAASMYYYSAQYQLAEELYRESIRVAPDNYKAHMNLADTLRQLPERDEDATRYYGKTIELAKEVVDFNPQDEEAHRHLALGYLFTNRVDLAKKHLDIATAINPKELYLFYAWAKYWTVVKNTDKVFEEAKKMIDFGYAWEMIDADPDFISLKKHQGYHNLIENIQRSSAG